MTTPKEREEQRKQERQRDFDRQVDTFARRYPAEKRHVIVLVRPDAVVVEHDSMMDDVGPRHRFAARLRLADRDVLDGRVLRIQTRQHRLVRMMQGGNRRHVDD